MKKVILSLAVLAGAAGSAHAQKHEHASTVGITAAYGRTSLLENNQYSSKNHSAYQAGLTADVYVAEALSFHPEVLYTKQYFDASNADLSRDIDYINVPLLARYHADGLFFEAGPEVNFAVKAKNEASDNVKSEVNKAVLDYVVGVGYQLNHGPSIGVRYDGGATNVFKSNTATTLGSGKFKSSTFLLVLGYSFGG